jgi:hypothetical protein
MKSFPAFLALAALFASPLARAQVEIPCPDCPEFTQLAYPETGVWSHPERPGTGLMFEIQRGILGGGLFGYGADGTARWYLISGPLQAAPDDPQVSWRLSTPALEFSGGSCISCSYEAPETPASAGTFEIEFLQRNLARYRIDEGEWTTIWPLTYGSNAPAHFTGISDYPIPDMAGPWILVYREFRHFFDPANPLVFPGLDEPWQGDDPTYYVQRVGFYRGTFFPQSRRYVTTAVRRVNSTSPEEQVYASIVCTEAPLQVSIGCELVQYFDRFGAPIQGGNRYHIPLGNLGDGRFKGQADDGATVQGFRLGYD